MAPLDVELLDLTNTFRGEHGLPPLRWHKGLASVAHRHATLVAEGRAPFSHAGAPERFAQCGARCINVAENLARSDGFCREDLPGAAVAGWCDSAGHRRNLLGPFDACGVGWAASDSGTIFVTQLLALVDEQNTWRSRLHAVAADAATSTPVVCAAVSLAFGGGAMLALAGGAVGSVLERRYGLRVSRAPRVLADRAAIWLKPATCANCGCSADPGELLATSKAQGDRSNGNRADAMEVGKLLCKNCHPSPTDADVWCYLG
mmetsp:Transcript_101287/g.253936  ORF Transcript_101287/g.253936 Transcript_101287/m.253936 type:complete len:261 (+) Transcript_101287:47-829(+)